MDAVGRVVVRSAIAPVLRRADVGVKRRPVVPLLCEAFLLSVVAGGGDIPDERGAEEKLLERRQGGTQAVLALGELVERLAFEEMAVFAGRLRY